MQQNRIEAEIYCPVKPDPEIGLVLNKSPITPISKGDNLFYLFQLRIKLPGKQHSPNFLSCFASLSYFSENIFHSVIMK